MLNLFPRYRVESRIANAICKNNQLLKVGLRFEFPEVMDRVQFHLIKNIDRLRKDRVKKEGPSKGTDWTPARMLDQEGEEGEEEEGKEVKEEEEELEHVFTTDDVDKKLIFL